MKIDTKIYKEKLKEELKILEEELSKVGIKDPSNPNNWISKKPKENISPADENEVADTIDDTEINNAIVNDLEIRYKNVKLALEKIEKGTYGICEVSGEQISEERLKANPSARMKKEYTDRDLK